MCSGVPPNREVTTVPEDEALEQEQGEGEEEVFNNEDDAPSDPEGTEQRTSDVVEGYLKDDGGDEEENDDE